MGSAQLVVMITGAGSGMGRVTALRLAATGAALGLMDVVDEALQEVVAAARRLGAKALGFPCDVRRRDAVADAVAAMERELGPLRAQINYAGVYHAAPLLELTEADWDFVMDVNAKGLFFSVQAAGRVMAPRGKGAIVNISSVAGRGGRPFNAHYAASKAAVIGITRSAALALGPRGVRVNAICPGVIETPMWRKVVEERSKLGGKESADALLERIPLGRLGAPEEVAAVATFLISEEASYVNGQALNVCGGLELD